jgi:ABC-type multidrug transport system fused ATPase/permease subunit
MTPGSEEAELGRLYDHRVVRKLWPFVKPYRGRVLLAAASAALFVLMQAIWPRIFADVAADWGGPDQARTVRDALLAFAVITLVGAVAEFSRTYLSDSTSQKVVADMRAALYARFQRLPMSTFDRVPNGTILARVFNDPNTLEGLLETGFVAFVGNGLLMIGIAVAMLVTNWKLALVAFGAVPVVTVLALVYRPLMRGAFREVRSRVSGLNARMEEGLSGHATVLLLNQEARCAAEFDQANAALRAAKAHSARLHAGFGPMLHGAFAVGLSLLLWYGGTGVLAGTVTTRELIAFLIYMNMFGWPLREMLERVQVLQSAMASLERIFGFLEQEGDDLAVPQTARPHATAAVPAIPEIAGTRSGDLPAANSGHVPEFPQPSPARSKGEVEFRDVWFAYRGDDWVLKGLSFHAAPGTRVAIAGPTGSGKTTVLSLAAALYRPQRGAIFLDGRDIATLDPRVVRRQVVTVMQDVFLFNDTVTENVRLWRESIGPDGVRDACGHAHAARFIERLADGYGQTLGERGATLSAGQRQLISYARALAYDPPILVLDEATSAVDAETEEAIRQGLVELTRGRTSLVVAHRFSTLADADRLLVIRDGRVAKETTPRAFLREKGRGAG